MAKKEVDPDAYAMTAFKWTMLGVVLYVGVVYTFVMFAESDQGTGHGVGEGTQQEAEHHE